MKITVETTIKAPIAEVWRAYTTPDDIKQWNAASDDWHTTKATVDLRVGGLFSARMEAKDGSFGFDFAGTYTKVVANQLIEYSFGDRAAVVEFVTDTNGVTVRVSFDAESEHPVEQQRQGWQAILDNFAKHVAARVNPVTQPKETIMHNPVGWFEIYVDDLQRARPFYEAVLQIKLAALMKTPEMELWSFPSNMERYGASGALVQMAGFPAGGNSTLVYFSCADCAVEAARVTAAGGRIQKQKTSIGEYGFIALAYDTEGNMFGLHSMK